MPGIEAFFDKATSTVTYLVWDSKAKRAAVIDAVADFDPATGRLGMASTDAVLARANEVAAMLNVPLPDR